MLKISVSLDGKPPQFYEQQDFPFRIGRGGNSKIKLNGFATSKEHLEVQQLGRSFKLIDLGSFAGTWVNGQRIVEFGPIDESDEIRIGGYKIRFTVGPVVRVLSESSSGPVEKNFQASGQSNQQNPQPTESTVAVKAPESGVETIDETAEQLAAHEALEKYLATFEWRKKVHRALIELIDLRRKDLRQLTDEAMRIEGSTLIREILKNSIKLPADVDQETLITEVLNEVVGLGPLESLLDDNSVSEIMVNSASEIYVERGGKLIQHVAAFTSDEAIRLVIDRIVAPLGRRIDESSPMVDARLKDGSRVNAVIPPLALRGPTITIRKFNKVAFTTDDYIRFGSASRAMFDFLAICVANRKNIVISGGTGSGKTTLLNLLSNMIPRGERVITIEDAAELKLNHPHLVSLEARPSNVEGRGSVSIRDLVRNSLRMRPDRIVVGECRGGEALDMLQAMNTGHDGSLTTAHANSPRDVLSRLEVMVLMSGMDIPMAAIREQIASAVDIIVQQTRSVDGARRITYITEVTGVENGTVQLQDIFRFNQYGFDENGKIRGDYSGNDSVPTFYEELRSTGHNLDLSIFEPVARGDR